MNTDTHCNKEGSSETLEAATTSDNEGKSPSDESSAEKENLTGTIVLDNNNNNSIPIEKNDNSPSVPCLSCHDDEELGRSLMLDPGDIINTNTSSYSGEAHFQNVCRLVIRLALAAMKFGSNSDRVEHFLPQVMHVFGYSPNSVFLCSTNELICKFDRRMDVEDCARHHHHHRCMMDLVRVKTGFSLTKLGLLSDLAKDILQGKLENNIQLADERLDEIEQAPDPWGPRALGFAFIMAGSGLPVFFNGTWWDVLCGAIAGGMTYTLVAMFEQFAAEEASIWLSLVASFCCSAFAAAVQLARPEISVTIVTVSGVIVLVPGATITLGLTDLVTRHIMSGFSRFIDGLVTMVWLSLGCCLGATFVDYVAQTIGVEQTLDGDLANGEEVQSVSSFWHVLFVPILCGSVPVLFQVSFKDTAWAMLSMFVAYAFMFMGTNALPGENLGTFLAAFIVTIFSNVWSRKYNRPNTIVLMPAFLLLVSGSVGFLGLTQILEGETHQGLDDFFHMFIVAGCIIAGILGGCTVGRPQATV